MSIDSFTDSAEHITASSAVKIQSIEKLLIGSGADLFRELELKIAKFCPFEAIGMVRQEIRHAHFLSYILDPNRAHPFKDHLLKIFLQEIIAQAQEGQIAIQPLTVHCSDYSNALVYRERDHIDFMIEVPPNPQGSKNKGLVVSVELKVYAAESSHQLNKYYQHVINEYPDKDWERVFVFLTLNGIETSEINSTNWVPVNLIELINRFNQEVQSRNFSGEAVDLYWNYASMIRRHLVKNEDLAQLAKNIWAKHKEALEALYDYRPDLQGEVLEWLVENATEVTEAVKKATGFTIVPDTSGTRILRYSIKEWCDFPGFCSGDTKWVNSGSIMVIELADWSSGRLRASFVLGPGDADKRTFIYSEVLNKVDKGEIKIGRRTAALGSWKHLSATDAQTDKDYAKAEINEVTAEELGRKVIKKITFFLEHHLPIYDRVVRDIFTN